MGPYQLEGFLPFPIRPKITSNKVMVAIKDHEPLGSSWPSFAALDCEVIEQETPTSEHFREGSC